MSLIRNGGFERGNTDFWSIVSDGSLDVSNVSPKYGTYCGKLTSNGASMQLLQSNDYISVSPYQVVNTTIYVKSASPRTVYLGLLLYDADYSYIDRIESSGYTMDGTWIKIVNQFNVPENTSYVRLCLRINLSSNGEVFYVDGTTLDILPYESGMSGIQILLPSDMRSSSGNSTNDKKSMIQYSTFFGRLVCTDVFGTDPTLDVTVYELNTEHEEVEIASFPQITAIGSYLINLPYCEGKEMYVKYTIGGTDPNFGFQIEVIGKR